MKLEICHADLLIALAVENCEIAMYEALAVASAAAGDTQTEHLAREIQQKKHAAAQTVWDLITPSARDAFQKVTGAAMARAAQQQTIEIKTIEGSSRAPLSRTAPGAV